MRGALALCLVLSFLSPVAFASSDPICEAALSRDAYLRLIEAALEKTLLKPEDLARLIQSPEPRHPFQGKPATVDTQPFHRGFADVMRAMPRSAWPDTVAKLQALAAKAGVEQEQKQDSQAETRFLYRPSKEPDQTLDVSQLKLEGHFWDTERNQLYLLVRPQNSYPTVTLFDHAAILVIPNSARLIPGYPVRKQWSKTPNGEVLSLYGSSATMAVVNTKTSEVLYSYNGMTPIRIARLISTTSGRTFIAKSGSVQEVIREGHSPFVFANTGEWIPEMASAPNGDLIITYDWWIHILRPGQKEADEFLNIEGLTDQRVGRPAVLPQLDGSLLVAFKSREGFKIFRIVDKTPNLLTTLDITETSTQLFWYRSKTNRSFLVVASRQEILVYEPLHSTQPVSKIKHSAGDEFSDPVFTEFQQQTFVAIDGDDPIVLPTEPGLPAVKLNLPRNREISLGWFKNAQGLFLTAENGETFGVFPIMRSR